VLHQLLANHKGNGQIDRINSDDTAPAEIKHRKFLILGAAAQYTLIMILR